MDERYELISNDVYNAMSDDEKIEYEEDIVQPIYDTLYNLIKSGCSTHYQRIVFLMAADQYTSTWNEAEESFFHRRLHQMRILHPELLSLLEKY